MFFSVYECSVSELIFLPSYLSRAFQRKKKKTKTKQWEFCVSVILIQTEGQEKKGSHFSMSTLIFSIWMLCCVVCIIYGIILLVKKKNIVLHFDMLPNMRAWTMCEFATSFKHWHMYPVDFCVRAHTFGSDSGCPNMCQVPILWRATEQINSAFCSSRKKQFAQDRRVFFLQRSYITGKYSFQFLPWHNTTSATVISIVIKTCSSLSQCKLWLFIHSFIRKYTQ